MPDKHTLIVAGNGMVGQRLLELLVAHGANRDWELVVFGEEARPAYDRVALSSWFNGVTADELSLVPDGFFDQTGVTLHVGDRIVDIDRANKVATSAAGTCVHYDALVLATGSNPLVPPIPGRDLPGTHTYRTIDDLEDIAADAAHAKSGAVIGGGLLGLEAANALYALGLETHVIEFAPRLMPAQLDSVGGRVLRERIEALGIHVHVCAKTSEIVAAAGGHVTQIRFTNGASSDINLDVDLVVFSTGIRPRDDLARHIGLDIGERGGVVVDESCRTSDPAIYAIGECALAQGRIWGLIRPGYAMAEVVADRLVNGEASDAVFQGADTSTKLKALGIDVASLGDPHADDAGEAEAVMPIVHCDPVTGVYKKLLLDKKDRSIKGAVLVGDVTCYSALTQIRSGAMPMPESPGDLIISGRTGVTVGVAALADDATICSCNNVTKAQLITALDRGACDVAALKAQTKAGMGCGGCNALLADLVRQELTARGIKTTDHLCEHFAYSRQELYDIVRSREIRTFTQLLHEYGKGRGCEICKPAVGSILASLSRGYILDDEQAALQDTNDHFLANMQKDGTYSIVPRVPGGEITPEKLIVLGEIARDFSLYTKITGAQRIDLFGARVEQLPNIWRRLIDVGFESGHAYAKAVRTVKSCVGSTWCRYGVGDSVSLAIDLEERYRGLRAPHKIKLAVSGCTRECAEAQGKDVGVIATERGWNLYVCGNGGMRPRHADLFAEDLDVGTLVQYVDRFLMLYVRSAGRLERTATWIDKRPGGIPELRRIIIDDALGICADLETDMAAHVSSYECEWRATLADPRRLARFTHFVNSTDPDPDVVFVTERGQPRPAHNNQPRDGQRAKAAIPVSEP